MNTRMLCAALGGFASALLLSTLPVHDVIEDLRYTTPQVIQGCEIDVRPLSKPEAQIYYKASRSSGKYTTTFYIHTMMSDVLEVSSWDATLQAVKLQDCGPNIVELSFDTNHSPIQARLKVTWPDGTVKLDEPTDFWGSFDPLGSFQDPPSEESVTHPDPEGEKGRIRITSDYFGISMAFTLSDV